MLVSMLILWFIGDDSCGRSVQHWMAIIVSVDFNFHVSMQRTRHRRVKKLFHQAELASQILETIEQLTVTVKTHP